MKDGLEIKLGFVRGVSLVGEKEPGLNPATGECACLHTFITCTGVVLMLSGVATSIAFRPDNECVLLLGVDTGDVYECSTFCLRHSLYRYAGHTSSIRGLLWNTHHDKIFLSCSLDWNVKVWLHRSQSPLVTLDLGGPVAGVTWSPYTSTVVVAVTEECRIHVYDLFLRQCRPLCVQNVAPRRRIIPSCIAFSPFYPVIVIGGDSGYLVLLKLSPNLRKVHKNTRDLDACSQKEVEHCKMERLIAINKG
nr:dynein intermediate chain 2, ciliary-like [Cherax quadricarinatus]